MNYWVAKSKNKIALHFIRITCPLTGIEHITPRFRIGCINGRAATIDRFKEITERDKELTEFRLNPVIIPLNFRGKFQEPSKINSSRRDYGRSIVDNIRDLYDASK